MLNETRFIREPVRLAWNLPRLVSRTETPTSVIVLPGLGGDDNSTIPLRWFLRRSGHRVEGWELGFHRPHVLTTLDRFTERLITAADIAGEPVTLVGWSLGGVVAREVARDRPDLVSQVVTFGSPISGPRHTAAPWVGDERALVAVEGMIARRNRRPIRVPVTTIYSRRDGIVDWRRAIDRAPRARNIEVASSHLGLGIDPDVWRAVADAIGEHRAVMTMR